MKIIVDCQGGDFCPQEAVAGALYALAKSKTLSVVLAGVRADIESILSANKYDKSRLEILDAQEVITCDDPPALAVRRKKESSTVKGLRLLKDGGADGMVSSANTGALLIGGTIILGLGEGVTRAAMCPVMPTLNDTHTILVDGGANVDCKVEQLKEFAVMGAAYMREIHGISSPKVGLLNNGAEAEKGNAQTKSAHALLCEADGINFIGNVEAKDFLTGVADVLVTDGFVGNAAMKASEGMGSVLFSLIKRGIMSGGLRAKLGYLMLKPVLRNIKHKMSGDAVGGAVFLGLNKVLVKAHGASKATAFCNAIIKAEDMAERDVPAKIVQGLNK
ncbi:MAG: phosphate acyltransferase PlsX [Clostridia bacterium]|nr:phosphate acyltransferase PlsX [Clostridia bacterium]